MFCRISEDHLSGPGSLGERLRALPAFTPPPGGWQRLEWRRAAARRRRYALTGGGLALAASVLVAIGLVGLKPAVVPVERSKILFAADNPVHKQELARLIDRSQNLERELQSARPQVAVWSSSSDARATMIEQQLRVVDAQLNLASSPDSAEKLWRDRVRLMNALLELHQPQEPALQYASYSY
jgi:hypothetical protein